MPLRWRVLATIGTSSGMAQPLTSTLSVERASHESDASTHGAGAAHVRVCSVLYLRRNHQSQRRGHSEIERFFTLSYGEAMLVQSAFFAAYFVVSLPAAAIVQRFGYMRTAVIGLLTMTAGCVLFMPASASGVFVAFLLALFVLASGITIVQVVANPLISLRPAVDRAQSPHVCAGVQFARHDGVSVRRIDLDSRLARDHGSAGADRRRTRSVSSRRNAGRLS